MTSSGIDASMQRIIWDAGRYLIPIVGTSARKQYEESLKQALSSTKEKVDDELKQAIISTDPAERLLVHYLKMKTKASFQGSGDLKRRVRNTLGVPNSAVTDGVLESLDPLFEARNNIAHSMDYERPRDANRRARVHRSVDDVTDMCNNALSVGADLLHAISDVILAHR